MYHILIVDDDPDTLHVAEQFLDREGYLVVKASSAREALAVIEKSPPELCIITTALAEMDSLKLCNRLRANTKTVNIPIIFLGHPNSDYRIDQLFDAGGDDYLRKPFALRELAARVRAHLRRTAYFMNDSLPTLRIFPESMTVYVNDRHVHLTQVEFELLLYLSRAPQQLHSTQSLLTEVWHYPRGTGDSALVRNHVRNLRRKLEDDPERPAIIQSRHGRGYAVKANVQIQTRVAGGVC
jgi:DNA-binding response OmpR family regulator